jgi:hypothetical protein
MVPIDSPWVVSYMTSIGPDIVSLTVAEIFDVKISIENALETNWGT